MSLSHAPALSADAGHALPGSSGVRPGRLGLAVRATPPPGARRVVLSAARAEALAAATPAGRDRTVDALRVASIAVVVLGHWLMATVTVAADGTVSAGNALAAAPGWAYLTWLLQVVPIFFLVGGFGHAMALRSGRSYADFVRGRVARLLRPTVAFLAVWVAAAAALGAAGLDRGVLALALRTVPQPLWFVGVYLGVVGLAPLLWRWHRAHGAAVPVVLGLGTAAVDVVRFRLGVGGAGALNVALVWLAVHQLGFLLADGRLTRRAGGLLAAGGGAALALLSTAGPYPVSMVGLPGDPVSNVNPPTVALLAQAVMLAGVVVLLRPALARSLQDSRVWTVVVAANGVVMTVFLWHLTALLALTAALLATGVPMPDPGTAVWWTTRPLWIAALIASTVPLVAAFRAAERPVAAPGVGREGTGAAAAGVAACSLGVLGLSAVGLHGLLTGVSATLVVLPLTAPVALGLVAAGRWALSRPR